MAAFTGCTKKQTEDDAERQYYGVYNLTGDTVDGVWHPSSGCATDDTYTIAPGTLTLRDEANRCGWPSGPVVEYPWKVVGDSMTMYGDYNYHINSFDGTTLLLDRLQNGAHVQLHLVRH